MTARSWNASARSCRAPARRAWSVAARARAVQQRAAGAGSIMGLWVPLSKMELSAVGERVRGPNLSSNGGSER